MSGFSRNRRSVSIFAAFFSLCGAANQADAQQSAPPPPIPTSASTELSTPTPSTDTTTTATTPPPLAASADVPRATTPTTAMTPPTSTGRRGEEWARQTEPYRDAPGVTPIEDPVRATSGHRYTSARFEGFYRVRGDLGYNWDLNRGPLANGAPVWPVAYIDAGASRWQTNADMRLRLDGEVTVGYGVSFRTRLHVLDNLRLGSTPDSDFVGATFTQRSPSSAIDVRQLYGEVLLPFGILRAGRMGGLVDWGTGFFVNAGNNLDDDFGDVGDRVSFTTSLGGLLWTALYEITASGPGSELLDSRVKPSFDLDPRDDVRTVAFSLAKWDTTDTRRRLQVADRTRVNFGLLGSYRWQDYDFAPGAAPAMRNAIPRGLGVIVADAWLRVDASRFTFEAEVGFVRLDVKNISLDPTVMTNIPITGTQFGAVVRADWRASSRFFSRLEVGVASGDSAPGFGSRPVGIMPTQPGDLDGPQFDLTRPIPDSTIDNFRFHPNYRIDLLLFRRLIGLVTDTVYFRPMVRWRVGPMVTLEGAVIGSLALLASSTPGGAAPLGVETNIAMNYEQEWGFLGRIEYGLLVPLSGFADAVRGISASPAHALRATLAYRF